MNECKVCIVDSGITDTKDIGFIGGTNLVEREKSNFRDYNGHGSMCLSTIRKIVPNFEYYVIRIFGQELKCSTFQLMEALSYLLTNDAQIINLSLSTTGIKYKKDIQNLCKQLYQQGKIVIASCDNRNNISIPAECKYTLGVRGTLINSIDRYYFNRWSRIQCLADSTPILVKGLENQVHFFGGNSKATACMTGIILKMWKQHKDENSHQIINRILKNSDSDVKKVRCDDLKMCSTRSVQSNYTEEDTEMLYEILGEVLNIENEKRKIPFNESLIDMGLNCENSLLLLHRIEKDFHLKLSYEDISLNDVNSIDGLTGLIAKGRKIYG